MPRLHVLQSNFITGQMDAAAAARSETSLYRNGAAALHNCEPLVSGGVRSRRGSWHRATLAGPSIVKEFAFSLSQSYAAVFSANRVDFFYASDGAAAGFLTGCPWSGDILRELRFDQLGDVMWVAHPSFPTMEITRTGSTTWKLTTMEFDNARGMPTYRYAPSSITCQSGGGTAGSLTLAATPTIDGVPTALWVGMAGQARLTAGPGPWRAFTVTAIAGLKLSIAWVAEGLDVGAGLDVQLEGSPLFGGGGGSTGGDQGGGGGSGGAGGGDASGPGGDGGPGDAGGPGGDPSGGDSGGSAAP